MSSIRLSIHCGVLALATLVIFTSSAHAGPAEDAAGEAYEVHQENCANLQVGETTGRAKAMAAVSPVWANVDAVYQETTAYYLLYWRGVLAQCLGQLEPAIADFQYFLGSQGGSDTFATLVRDAKTRLRRMGAPVTAITPPEGKGSYEGDGSDIKTAEDERRRPLFLIGVGGGYQRTGDWSYGVIAVDASIRLKRDFRLEVFVRPAIGEPARALDGGAYEGEATYRPILTTFGVGPRFYFLTTTPLRPHAGLLVQLAVNSGETNPGNEKSIWPFLIGVVASGGVDFKLGDSPLSIGPNFEAGFMGPHGIFRAMVQVRIAL